MTGTQRAASVLAALTGLAAPGCIPVGPDYKGAPKVPHSEHFFGARATQRAAPDIDHWWSKLGSKELNALIGEALQQNYDIAIGAQRLREARALRRQAASALLPRADANLSFNRIDFGGLINDGDLGALGASGLITNPLDYWGSGVDVAWEVDVFGGQRRRVRGARAREEASREALRGAKLAVAAELADAYFTIATLREQQAELQAQVDLQEKQTADTRARAEAGDSSKLDLDRSRARLETTRAGLPELEAGVTAQLRRIALLLGERPDALDGERIANRSLPDRLPLARTGIPAELVLRRPDLRRAERELAAATEEIGVAVAEFYPKFRIAGGPAGFGDSFPDLFNASNLYWQYGPRVDWSPFTGGANKAALEAANARQRAAMLAYEKAVLAAIGEVEIELANLRAETQRLGIVQRARSATAAAARRVRENYEAGAADFVEVLIEEERLRVISINEIRNKGQMLQVWIRLHKALGGGWQ